MAKLQLATALLLLVALNIMGGTEQGRTAELVQRVMLIQAALVLGCYALSRTRHVRMAVWVYVAVALSMSPISLAVAKPTTGILPVMAILVLFPSVLLVNAFISARAALVTGLLAPLPTLMVYPLYGNPYWVELMRSGVTLFLAFVVLTVIFGVFRDGVESDRMAELQARNHELEELRRTLDDEVEARTRELSERNAAMHLVFDNVAQGIFTVAPSGGMPAEHSSVLSKWFGPFDVGEPFFRYLGRQSAHFAELCAAGWEQLMEDVLPQELALAQLPSSLQAGPKSYRLSYEPINADPGRRILIVVSDVTAEVQRERVESEKRETFSVFEHVLGNRRGLIDFMREASDLMAQLTDPSTQRTDTLRALHTLKGNAMLFGFESVGRMCHELESKMTDGGPMDEEQLASLSERWQRLSADLDRLFGVQKGAIELSLEEHTALKRAAREYGAREELIRWIDGLAFEPMERRLSHFVDHAQRLATRFDKRVQVDVVHGDIRLDDRPWSMLWAVLVHAVRNAIDHGIEPVEERHAAGKSEQSHLVFRALREGEDIILEIEDDGRGFDWQAIARKCEAMHLPSRSRADLLEGLFAEGMSTAQVITDISGRGIGMGAIRSAVRSLAGELFIESEAGKGTRLRMVFSPMGAPKSSTLSSELNLGAVTAQAGGEPELQAAEGRSLFTRARLEAQPRKM